MHRQLLAKFPIARKVFSSCALLLLAGHFHPVVLAQGSDAIMIDVSSCILLESARGRFNCYEEQVKSAVANDNIALRGPVSAAAVSTATASPSSPPTVQQAAPAQITPSVEASQAQASATAVVALATVEDAANSFGFPEERGEKKTTEIFGTIASVRETYPDRFEITLENGQVWNQMAAKRGYNLEVGQEARIYSTRWGSSYRLAVEELGTFIQVERLK